MALDATNPSPRINAALMGEFVGKRVTLVGRVEGVDGNTLQLRTADDGLVSVQLQSIAPQVRGRGGGGWRCRVNEVAACCNTVGRLARAAAGQSTM